MDLIANQILLNRDQLIEGSSEENTENEEKQKNGKEGKKQRILGERLMCM